MVINWYHKRSAAASSNFYFTTVTPHSENPLATSLSTTAGDELESGDERKPAAEAR